MTMVLADDHERLVSEFMATVPSDRLAEIQVQHPLYSPSARTLRRRRRLEGSPDSDLDLDQLAGRRWIAAQHDAGDDQPGLVGA